LQQKFTPMRKIFVAFLSAIMAFNVHASDSKKNSAINESRSSVISGRVIDKLTGEALAGVEIKLMDTDLKIYTDFDGNFEIRNINPGAHALLVDYISYQNLVENVHAEKNNTTEVLLKLKSVEK